LADGFGIGLPPILVFGSEDLKERVARPVLQGDKIICLAITEPGTGSDVATIECTAVKTPDGKHYIVNGEKKWITNGIYADFFTTAVRTGGAGGEGISLLVIERGPGVITRKMACSGMRGSGTTLVIFENAKVPVENIVGTENAGFITIMYNFNRERMALCIQANRMSRTCLEDSITYAMERKTFGKRLIDQPVIREKIGHMARQIEATQALIELMAFQGKMMSHVEALQTLGASVALLKSQATRTLEFCAREASQIFGGKSFTMGGQGGRVEVIGREARAFSIFAGSEENYD